MAGAFNRRDFDAVLPLIDLEIEFEGAESLVGGYVVPDMSHVLHGREAYLRWFEDLSRSGTSSHSSPRRSLNVSRPLGLGGPVGVRRPTKGLAVLAGHPVLQVNNGGHQLTDLGLQVLDPRVVVSGITGAICLQVPADDLGSHAPTLAPPLVPRLSSPATGVEVSGG